MKKMMILTFLAVSAFAAQIDTSKSTLSWQGTKVTGRHWGTIGIKSGNIELKDGVIKSGEVVVDIKSLDATDLEGEWEEKFNTHLLSADFFNAEKFPEAKLKIKKVEGQTAVADLTIKGKTNEVSFPVAKVGNRYVGSLQFDRTKFDMKYGSASFFKSLGDKAIDNEVNLVFDIVTK